ncbi:LPXTG cell wall anchor domain-containing protein [Microbacterium sp. G2-8]|uniref:LPXTG cell wall anchor domain-containing protein n=1 Tax=Microbacterium sp. G2-8 TaxID=2842454 RepID=UPI001C89BF85|nr:LPXTG cell wall anchor domain-containing protein [Microbacterium sp. G2-8]
MSITFTALAAAAIILAPLPADSGEDWDYTPETTPEPALNASASAACVSDAPWIDFDVTLVDQAGQSAPRDADLVFARGGERLVVPLGTIDETGRLSGRILWPGASVDDAGRGSDWPGWVLDDGEWLDVGDADLGWTRNGASVTIAVNPEFVAAVEYPPSTPTCVAGPRPAAERPGAAAEPGAAAGESQVDDLAATGTDIMPPLVVGAAALLAGVLLVARRRRS